MSERIPMTRAGYEKLADELKQLKTVDVVTALDGDEVRMSIAYDVVEGGPRYAAQQKVTVPAKKVELLIENFNFQRQ